jgi:hypothetical protein
MAPQHADTMKAKIPSAWEKIITLNVEDPIGMGVQVYEKTLLDIESKMKQYMDQILRLD